MRRVNVAKWLVTNETRLIESLHNLPDRRHLAEVLRRYHIDAGIDPSPHIHVQSGLFDVGSENNMVLVILPDGIVPETIDLLDNIAQQDLSIVKQLLRAELVEHLSKTHLMDTLTVIQSVQKERFLRTRT